MDPFNKTHWNLPQVLAWLYLGDRTLVRMADDDVEDHGTFWEEIPLPGGRKELVETQGSPASKQTDLWLTTAAAIAGGAIYPTLEDAETDVLATLQDGRLKATGLKNDQGDQAEIPRSSWPFLKFFYKPKPHAGPSEERPGATRWYALHFQREEVLALWPDTAAASNGTALFDQDTSPKKSVHATRTAAAHKIEDKLWNRSRELWAENKPRTRYDIARKIAKEEGRAKPRTPAPDFSAA